MNSRHNDLLKIRPKIKKVKDFPNMSDDERFQNETIRPILKLQNPLFILVFKNYIEKRKKVFYDLSLDKKMIYIESSIVKDQNFHNSLKGIIIGHFTVAEYRQYILHFSSLNKRMMNMLIKRLQNQIEVFDLSFSTK
ncbi:MAG: glyoxalase [Flavobacteriaceae bacterium]|nr:glyoxalase [Flavobacteriaceae bacterium]